MERKVEGIIREIQEAILENQAAIENLDAFISAIGAFALPTTILALVAAIRVGKAVKNAEENKLRLNAAEEGLSRLESRFDNMMARGE